MCLQTDFTNNVGLVKLYRKIKRIGLEIAVEIADGT